MLIIAHKYVDCFFRVLDRVCAIAIRPWGLLPNVNNELRGEPPLECVRTQRRAYYCIICYRNSVTDITLTYQIIALYTYARMTLAFTHAACRAYA